MNLEMLENVPAVWYPLESEHRATPLHSTVLSEGRHFILSRLSAPFQSIIFVIVKETIHKLQCLGKAVACPFLSCCIFI